MAVGIVGLVSSLLTIVVYLQPRIQIVPSGQISRGDSSSWSFLITNASTISIYDVVTKIGVCSISPSCDHLQDCHGRMTEGSYLRSTKWNVEAMPPDEGHTIEFGDVLGLRSGEICSADVNVSVTFRPWFLPFHKRVEQRFATEIRKDGTLVWRNRERG